MTLHHVVKLFINLLVFLLGVGGEDVGGITIRAVAASVLLLVQGLWVKKHGGGVKFREHDQKASVTSRSFININRSLAQWLTFKVEPHCLRESGTLTTESRQHFINHNKPVC